MLRQVFTPTLISCAVLAGCGRAPSTAPSAAAADPVSIQDVMVKSLAPQSTRLWELGAKLYADDGSIDPALLGAEDWAALKQAASGMRAASAGLQMASRPRVAAPGVKLQGEGTRGALGATEVQALIDAAPEAFSSEAGRLVETSDGLLSAIEARDGKALDELSGRLNEVCSSCHMRFWYPEAAQ